MKSRFGVYKILTDDQFFAVFERPRHENVFLTFSIMRFTLLLFFIAVIYGDESSEVAVEGEVADVVTGRLFFPAKLLKPVLESPPTTKASTTASTVSTEEQQETDEAITKEAAISNTTDPTQEATSNATQSTATTAQTPQATQKAQTTQSTQATQATQSTQAPQTTTQESAVIRQGIKNRYSNII